jgi:molecular chaperone DnaJ
MKNYYEILGISKDATQEEIKKVYRKLAIEYHPDRNPEGEEKFKEIAEAYDTLGDEGKRQDYNYKLQNPFSANRGQNPFNDTNFDDLLRQMFNENGQRRPRNEVPNKLIEVDINVLESLKGVTKTVTYSKKTSCGICYGNGGDKTTCVPCGGQGFVMMRAGTGMFTQVVRSVCNHCQGNGFTFINKCYSCNGNGTKDTIDTIQLSFPKNIDNGQQLRVSQKGDFYNGIVGDLIIRVKLTPTQGFEKINNDLVYNAYFNLDDLSKETFEVPHPDGKLLVKFPNDFNTQIPLRLKNKGFTNNSAGDLFVKMNVKYTRG